MVDSSVVLGGQTIAYTLYCSIIILLMIWFGIKLTSPGKNTKVPARLFYSFVIFLAVLGVSLHIITFNTIPWVPTDVNMKKIEADRTFEISVANHEFKLPSEKLVCQVGEVVKFSVTSSDLTYGFGLFRADNSMLMQMQVVPGHNNWLLWKFNKPGVYSIRSTEYSGPKGVAMVVKDAVEVVEKL